MNPSAQSILIHRNAVPLDRRAFMQLSIEQRRQLLELQATGTALYTPKSEALEWLEQQDDLEIFND